MNKSNYSYIGIAFIILVFGIIFIPKIVTRVQAGDITRTESRSDVPCLNTCHNFRDKNNPKDQYNKSDAYI